MLVVQAFKNSNLVPRQLRNMWNNVKLIWIKYLFIFLEKETKWLIPLQTLVYPYLIMCFGTIYLCLLGNLLSRIKLVYFPIGFHLLEGVLVWSPPFFFVSILSFIYIFWWLLAPLLQPLFAKKENKKKYTLIKSCEILTTSTNIKMTTTRDVKVI